MADFKTKLSLLAGAVAMFAGSAFGQATFTGTPVSATAGFIRAEGTTEKLPPITVNITGAVAGFVSLQVYIAPGLTITSQAPGSPAVSETTATANTGSVINGVVSGATVTFSNVATTAGTTSIVVDNIRVNASALAVANGVPTGVTEQVFLNGVNATPGVAAPVTVAYALNGLAAATSTAVVTSNTVCAGSAVGTLQFNVNIPENFSKAFKTKTEEQGTSAVAATSGTRFAITFNNIPSVTKVYVPAVTATPTLPITGIATAINSPTGAFAATTPLTGTLAGLVQVTIANGTGTVYYELTTPVSAGALETLTVPVYFVTASGALTAPTTAATATVSFAPIGSTTSVPNFVNGSSTTTVNGSTYSACATYLLFPYVTNAAGFETGIALSNTSLDNFAAKGASSAATQTGTCALNFYGNATAASNPAAFTTASIAGGTVLPFTLTSAAGANFTGYMIANCNFQYAHGFAYIVYSFGTSSGTAMGYVASPFGVTGVAARTLAAGTAESLGN